MASYIQAPQQQQQVVFQQMPNNDNSLQFYKRCTCKLIGLIIFLCSILVIVLEIYYLSDHNDKISFKIGTGIWTGAVYLPAGILGIISGHNPSRCNIVANMTLCIIAAVMTVPAIALHLGAYFTASDYYGCAQLNDRGWVYVNGTSVYLEPLRNEDCVAMVRGTNITMTICAVIILVSSILAASLCCQAVCSCCRDGGDGGCCGGDGCCDTPAQRTVVVYYGQPGSAPNIGHIPTAQAPPTFAVQVPTAATSYTPTGSAATAAPPPYDTLDTKKPLVS